MKTQTLFGSFEKRLSTPVFANDWWLFHASGVRLEGEHHTSLDLAALLPESAAKRHRPMPGRIDLEWLREVGPIGLQLRATMFDDLVFSLGLVACRVVAEGPASGGRCDIAYPLLFLEHAGRLLIQFSSEGPEPEIQRSIVCALAERLMW